MKPDAVPGGPADHSRGAGPALDALDLAAVTLLSLVWACAGVFAPVGTASAPADWSAPLAGGIALGIATAGPLVWLRRRWWPALAVELWGWAALGGAAALAFIVALVLDRRVGHATLLLGGALAFWVSLALGWRLTPLIAFGRCGALVAMAFAAFGLAGIV